MCVMRKDSAKAEAHARPVGAEASQGRTRFVEAGQPVTVKLEAFPFTRYGTLEGKLAWISRDAIQDEKLGPVYAARVTVTPPPRDLWLAPRTLSVRPSSRRRTASDPEADCRRPPRAPRVSSPQLRMSRSR